MTNQKNKHMVIWSTERERKKSKLISHKKVLHKYYEFGLLTFM